MKKTEIAFSQTGRAPLLPDLEVLAPILDAWVDVMQECLTQIPQERDFWYTERGMVAMLCAACWRTGVPALAEAKTEKFSPGDPAWKGHADLLIASKAGRFGIEAKATWLTHVGDASRVAQEFRLAVGEAACLDARRFSTALGVAFVLFEPQDGQSLAELFHSAAGIADPGPEAVAWAFVEHTPNYPGALLVARRAEMLNGRADPLQKSG